MNPEKGLKPFNPLNRILNDYEDKREIPFGFGENLLSIFLTLKTMRNLKIIN